MFKKYKDFIDHILSEKYEDVSELTQKTDPEDWKVVHFPDTQSMEAYFNGFWKGKEWLSKDGDFDVYLWVHIMYDKVEKENYWQEKVVIKVDWKNNILKTKEILSEPLLSVRDNNLTKLQEQRIRIWCGTNKHPESGRGGTYIGMENGLAIIKTKAGSIYKIQKDGMILEEDEE